MRFTMSVLVYPLNLKMGSYNVVQKANCVLQTLTGYNKLIWSPESSIII